MKVVDALVIGAGVAGASAALHLAKAGARVTLVDRARLPRDKVCGCCLNATAVSLLRELGLGEALERAGSVPTTRITLCSPGRAVTLPSRGGRSLSRSTLDVLLADAAVRAGCAFLSSTSARIERLPAHSRETVHVRVSGAGRGAGGQTIRAGVVLVADGLAGTSTAGIGAGKRKIDPGSLRGYGALLPADRHDSRPGQIVMCCGGAGYVGTVVLEDGRLDIAAALKPGAVKALGGPARAVARVVMDAGQPLDGIDTLRWRATAPLTGARERLSLPGVLILGDAAGYVEPFTGEGMAWALRSAHAATPIVLSAIANGWRDAHGRQWDRVHRSAVRRGQWRCRLFSKLLRRPVMTDAALGVLGRVPACLVPIATRVAFPPVCVSSPPHPMEQRPCA
jgi:flavin-dependent dehydrogenase